MIYEGQQRVAEGQGGLDACSVVYDAEALGALRGLERATNLYPDAPVTLCIDNTATIWSAQKDAPTTSQWVFVAIHWITADHEVTIKWSPGHMGIAGNEAADELAKAGAEKGPRDPGAVPTAAGIKAIARQQIRKQATKWWTHEDTNVPSHFLTAKIKYTPGKCPKALTLERKVLGQYLGVLSAHGDFKWYHDRYNHRDAEVHCPCTSYAHGRQEKGPQRMVHCYALRSTVHTWPRPPKPEKRRDRTEWPEDSGPIRLHRLDLTSSTSREGY